MDRGSAGDMMAIMAIGALSCITLWNGIADKCSKHILVLCLISAGFAFTLQGLWIIPFSSYWKNFMVFGIYGALRGGVLPLNDYSTIKLLLNRYKLSRSLYGKQRLWGSVAYTFMNLLFGSLIDIFGFKVYFWAVPISVAVMIVVLWFAAVADREPLAKESGAAELLGGDGDPKVNDSKVKSADSLSPIEMNSKELSPDSPPAHHNIYELFYRPEFSLYLFAIFVAGIGHKTVSSFIGDFMEQRLMLTKQQISITTPFSVTLTLIIFYFSDLILNRFDSRLILMAGQISVVLRLLLYLNVVPGQVGLVFLIELFNGTSFCLIQIAGVKIAHDYSLPGLLATSQAIFSLSFNQIPSILVLLFGSKVYGLGENGDYLLFKGVFCACLVFSAISSSLLLLCVKRRESERGQ